MRKHSDSVCHSAAKRSTDATCMERTNVDEAMLRDRFLRDSSSVLSSVARERITVARPKSTNYERNVLVKEYQSAVTRGTDENKTPGMGAEASMFALQFRQGCSANANPTQAEKGWLGPNGDGRGESYE